MTLPHHAESGSPDRHTAAEANAALTRLIMRELSDHPEQYFRIGELSRRTHTLAFDVARTIGQLEKAGLIEITRRKGLLTVHLSGNVATPPQPAT